jgi:hypothetical protein
MEGSGPGAGVQVIPNKRPAPRSDDAHRAPGQTWVDSRYDKPFAARNKRGQLNRFKTRQGAQQHAQNDGE